MKIPERNESSEKWMISREHSHISVTLLTHTGSWGHSHFICSLENSLILHWEKTHQGLSCKKTSLQSRQDGLGRFPGRILQQFQTQSVPDDGYLKKPEWELSVLSPELAMATLIWTEMNSMERGKCTLSLLMGCKFKYFYQVEETQAMMAISDHSRTTRRGQAGWVSL